jgi:hypothetical protein
MYPVRSFGLHQKIHILGGAHHLVRNHRQAANQGWLCAVARKHGQRFANLFGQVGHVYMREMVDTGIIASASALA